MLKYKRKLIKTVKVTFPGAKHWMSPMYWFCNRIIINTPLKGWFCNNVPTHLTVHSQQITNSSFCVDNFSSNTNYY